jgi:hypothetical protein
MTFSTALYFIPFLDRYVGNAEALITRSDNEQLKISENPGLMRQILVFIVITIYPTCLN